MRTHLMLSSAARTAAKAIAVSPVLAVSQALAVSPALAAGANTRVDGPALPAAWSPPV